MKKPGGRKSLSDQPRRPVASHERRGSSVFSYYSKRPSPAQSPVAPSKTRISPSDFKVISWNRWLRQLPFLLAAAGIGVSVLYAVTTDMTPKIIVSKDSEAALLRPMEDYQAATKRYLQSSILARCKLLIDTGSIKQKLLHDYPELADADVTIPILGRRPVVSLAAARPAIVLSSGHGAYVVDSRGKAILKIEDAKALDKDELPVVTDQSGLDLDIGKNILTGTSVNFIEVVNAQLKAQHLKVNTLTLPPAASELIITIEGLPYSVKFNLLEDARQQSGAFLALKAKLDGDKKTPAEYVDVRVPEKVYYK